MSQHKHHADLLTKTESSENSQSQLPQLTISFLMSHEAGLHPAIPVLKLQT